LAGLYRHRWQIEELFRTLKTRGFDIERVTIAEGPFKKLAAAALVAAVSVLQLVQERDGRAKRPLEDVFHLDERQALEAVSASLEGKTERQKNLHPKGSLAYAAWVCARLGGWTGYYGKPGPIVMLRGLHQFRAIQHGLALAQNV
jgi:Transposase DDE domain